MSNEKPHINDETFLARWLAGELSEEEVKAFENHEEFGDFKKIASVSDSLSVQEFDVDNEFSRLKDRIEKPQQATIFTLPRARFISIAATILIAAFTGLYLAFFQSSGLNLYQTAFGETKIIILPDGSEIVLNANSSLSFDEEQWETSRLITLDGEAFFDVTSGNTFKVSTPLGEVEVLGTEFNVKNRKGLFTATCYEGRVAVKAANIERVLEAGSQIQFEVGAIVSESGFEDVLRPSWMSGIITLENVPLEVAFDEVTAQYGVTFFNVPDNDELRFTGSFPTNNVDTALRLVLEPFGFAYSYNSDTKTLTIHN
ncbi:MAG: hypothetical protein ED557_05560 [Balneola sp.]|nr:MAG: hypothetical protein ED557_05560 [Balneola sp.]